MPQVLPPPPERFDPITARWGTPGGPLHDPERDGLDTDPRDPVTLVEPIPPELDIAPDRPGIGTGRSKVSPARRFRWLVLAVLAIGVTAVIVATLAQLAR